jgi:hypothetical protein
MIFLSAAAAVVAIEASPPPPPPPCLAPNFLMTLPHDVAPKLSGPACLRHGTKIYRVPTYLVDDTVVDAKGMYTGERRRLLASSGWIVVTRTRW